jgi:hypothetical protein
MVKSVGQSAASCCLLANVESVLVRVLCWIVFFSFFYVSAFLTFSMLTIFLLFLSPVISYINRKNK